MNKTIVDCTTKSVSSQELTIEEVEQNRLLEQQREEQDLINNLKPTQKEVLMAEIELNTINLLLELGVF
jgi:hypothetical protein